MLRCPRPLFPPTKSESTPRGARLRNEDDRDGLVERRAVAVDVGAERDDELDQTLAAAQLAREWRAALRPLAPPGSSGGRGPRMQMATIHFSGELRSGHRLRSRPECAPPPASHQNPDTNCGRRIS